MFIKTIRFYTQWVEVSKIIWHTIRKSRTHFFNFHVEQYFSKYKIVDLVSLEFQVSTFQFPVIENMKFDLYRLGSSLKALSGCLPRHNGLRLHLAALQVRRRLQGRLLRPLPDHLHRHVAGRQEQASGLQQQETHRQQRTLYEAQANLLSGST